jgi:hypothetical protein
LTSLHILDGLGSSVDCVFKLFCWEPFIDGGIVINWSQQKMAEDANDKITRAIFVRLGWKRQIFTKSCPQTPVGKMCHFNDRLPCEDGFFRPRFI